MGKLGKIPRNILIVCGALFILLGCGRPDGFYGCHDYVCAAVRRSGLLAAELTRRLSYGILFQKGKQSQPLPALRQ